MRFLSRASKPGKKRSTNGTQNWRTRGYVKAARGNIVVGQRYLLTYFGRFRLDYLNWAIEVNEYVICVIGANSKYLLLPERNRKYGYLLKGQWAKALPEDQCIRSRTWRVQSIMPEAVAY